jgi:rhodanese-related sulfurtransferase
MDRSLLRQLAALLGTSMALGAVRLGVSELPWVADPPAETSSCGDPSGGAPRAIERITVARAREFLGRPGVTFVDARPRGEYDLSHIPGAFSLPADDAADLLEVSSVPITPEDLVITYCDGGACERSEYLGMLLEDRDTCRDAYVLDGGWRAWLAAGSPTTTPDTTAGAQAP